MHQPVREAIPTARITGEILEDFEEITEEGAELEVEVGVMTVGIEVVNQSVITETDETREHRLESRFEGKSEVVVWIDGNRIRFVAEDHHLQREVALQAMYHERLQMCQFQIYWIEGYLGMALWRPRLRCQMHHRLLYVVMDAPGLVGDGDGEDFTKTFTDNLVEVVRQMPQLHIVEIDPQLRHPLKSLPLDPRLSLQ